MSHANVDELSEFYHFLGTRLTNGGAGLSPEEALDEWRSMHPDTAADEAEAIREALDDIANGDQGVPLEDFDREFRKRHNISPAP